MSRVLFTMAFALAILVSVSLHEAGHLIAAKRFGMKVTHYFVGYGPTVFSWRRGETEYGLKWIPLGGFCRIAGMTPDDDLPAAERHRAMWRFPVWKRTVVMAAGVVVQLGLALAGLFLGAAFVGLPNLDYPQTAAQRGAQPAVIELSTCVTPEAVRACAAADPASPARAAGLRDGDLVTAVGGTPVATYADLVRTVRQAPPGPTAVTYRRDGGSGTATVELRAVRRPPADDPAGPVATVSALGVGQRITAPREVTYGPADAFGATARYAHWMAGQTYESFTRIPAKVPALWRSVTGGERDPETPTSVVGVSLLGGEAAALGLWPAVLMIFIGLNVFMAFFNLLPLLPLDGGHIALAWFERLRSWLAARFRRRDPGRVDHLRLMPLTYAVIAIGGAFTLLTVIADIVNPITIG